MIEFNEEQIKFLITNKLKDINGFYLSELFNKVFPENTCEWSECDNYIVEESKYIVKSDENINIIEPSPF